jgi:hypothetical protein
MDVVDARDAKIIKTHPEWKENAYQCICGVADGNFSSLNFVSSQQLSCKDKTFY